jgi:hypothetical protein
LSLDIKKELMEMAEAYGLTEKEVLQWYRGAIRSMWGSSIFKRSYEASTVKMVKNDNARSMKRYPMVKRFTCTSCGLDYGTSGVELDHRTGENKLTSYDHVESFTKAILFSKPDQLQWLCGSQKKTVNKKKVVVVSGCHQLKSMAEKNPDLIEAEVRAKVEVARIKKYGDIVVALKDRDVVDLPKFKKDQEKLLLELLTKEYK